MTKRFITINEQKTNLAQLFKDLAARIENMDLLSIDGDFTITCLENENPKYWVEKDTGIKHKHPARDLEIKSSLILRLKTKDIF